MLILGMLFPAASLPPHSIFFSGLTAWFCYRLVCCFFDSVYFVRQMGSRGRGFMAVGRRTFLVEVRASAHNLTPDCHV